MRKDESIILFVITLLLILRDYVPFIGGHTSLTGSLLLYSIAYISFMIVLGPKVIRKYLWLAALPLMNLIFSIVNPKDGSFMMMSYSFIQLFIWVFVCEFIIKCNNDKIIKLLFYSAFIVVIVTSITTYNGCLLVSGASRELATGLLDESELALYYNLNIGGFKFIYTLVLLLPLMLYMLRFSAHKLLEKVLIVAIIALFMATVYVAEYSTAILLSLLSLSILFLPPNMSFQKAIIVVVGLALLATVIYSVLPSLLALFAENTESYDVSIRMEELSDIMSGKQTRGDGQKRIELWTLSWTNFINNPILGTGTKGGGHSLILDHLSKYGIIGLILVVLQFRSLFSIVLRPYFKTSYHTLFLLMYVMNIILCLVNTYFLHGVFLVFVPLFIKYLSLKNVDGITHKNVFQ